MIAAIVTSEHGMLTCCEQRCKCQCATLTHMTSSVGIRALQQNASGVVRRAAAGEVVEITDRGRLVARLVPPPADKLAGLVEAGLARAARTRLVDLPAPLPAGAGPALTQVLAEQRADER